MCVCVCFIKIDNTLASVLYTVSSYIQRTQNKQTSQIGINKITIYTSYKKLLQKELQFVEMNMNNNVQRKSEIAEWKQLINAVAIIICFEPKRNERFRILSFFLGLH